jgi:hypothetical protein
LTEERHDVVLHEVGHRTGMDAVVYLEADDDAVAVHDVVQLTRIVG